MCLLLMKSDFNMVIKNMVNQLTSDLNFCNKIFSSKNNLQTILRCCNKVIHYSLSDYHGEILVPWFVNILARNGDKKGTLLLLDSARPHISKNHLLKNWYSLLSTLCLFTESASLPVITFSWLQIYINTNADQHLTLLDCIVIE